MTEKKSITLFENEFKGGHPPGGPPPGGPPRISILINSQYYFLQHVLIVSYGGVFRLLVRHMGRGRADRVYRSARGARIGFSRSFGHHAWKKSITPQWSRFYPPDPGWLARFLDL